MFRKSRRLPKLCRWSERTVWDQTVSIFAFIPSAARRGAAGDDRLARIKKLTAKDVACKKQVFSVLECMFHRRVFVFINYSNAEFTKYVERHWGAQDRSARPDFDDNFAAFSCSIETKGKPTFWVIAIKRFEWSMQDINSLIHEIVHTVIKIWAINNIPFTVDNQEFLAHSIGNMYEDIARKIWHLRKRR